MPSERSLVFVGKLRYRGFDPVDIRTVLNKYSWNDKSHILNRNVAEKKDAHYSFEVPLF